MPRRLLSLLAFLLLLLATQAVADDDGGDKDDRDDERDEDDEGRDDRDRRSDEDDDDKEDEDDEGKDDHRERKDREGKKERARRDEGPKHAIASAAGNGPVDVGLTILPTGLPGRAQFSFLVAAAGSIGETTLAAELPQTGRPWMLSGPGAPACDVAGLHMACDFDGLSAGEVQLVQATSPLGRVPTWALTATGSVDAGDGGGVADAVPRNDSATASLGLFLR